MTTHADVELSNRFVVMEKKGFPGLDDKYRYGQLFAPINWLEQLGEQEGLPGLDDKYK